jgi:hypothetical protein
VNWYVVMRGRKSKSPRPTHVLIGDEDMTIWTPGMAGGTAFPARRAREIAKLKRTPTELVRAIPKTKLDQIALEWYLEEQRIP